jgi:zinc protease
VNVLNQPYGGFPWLWMPQYANSNWYNSHNFYGELKDIEAATLDEVQAFFKTYYAPNNAALAIVGDFDPEQAKAMIAKYFGGIAPAKLPPPPDLTEPRQEKEKTATRKDPLANRPALAFSYHMPPRNSPEYFAMGLLDQMLVQGDDSLLYQELVKKHGFTGDVSGAINETWATCSITTAPCCGPRRFSMTPPSSRSRSCRPSIRSSKACRPSPWTKAWWIAASPRCDRASTTP